MLFQLSTSYFVSASCLRVVKLFGTKEKQKNSKKKEKKKKDTKENPKKYIYTKKYWRRCRSSCKDDNEDGLESHGRHIGVLGSKSQFPSLDAK